MIRSLLALLVACGIYVSLTPLEAMNVSYFSKTFLFTFTSFGCAAAVFASLSLQLRSSLKSVVTLIAQDFLFSLSGEPPGPDRDQSVRRK